jgi:hypothetical protein
MRPVDPVGYQRGCRNPGGELPERLKRQGGPDTRSKQGHRSDRDFHENGNEHGSPRQASVRGREHVLGFADDSKRRRQQCSRRGQATGGERCPRENVAKHC